MDFNPYTHIPTITVGTDGTHAMEAVPAPDGYSPNFDRQSRHDSQWTLVRTERDKRLAACDWVVTMSVERAAPVAKEWLDYRQSLRDVTKQLNPFQIVWPNQPVAAAPAARQYVTADAVTADSIPVKEL